MSQRSTIQSYLKGLERRNFQDIITRFAADAIVHSPLYGNVQASLFYKELFSDSRNSKITMKNIFFNPDNPNSAAVHFVYVWALQNGSTVQFECVDVIEFAEGSDLIRSLTIIYDTYPVREIFAKSKATAT